MGKTYARRERWFDAGAAAVAATFPDAPADAYVCPLCGRAFSRDALRTRDLTEEHVPPKHAGGRALLLTCARCNNRAGAELDSYAEAVDAVGAVLGAKTGRAVRAVMTVDGVSQRIQMDASDDGGLRFMGVPAADAPWVPEQMAAVADAWTAEGSVGRSIQVEFTEKVDLRRAALSWARAAYLVAFCCFGYRYAFSPALLPLVEQLQRPDEVLIAPPVLRWEGGTQQVAAVREPAEMRGIAVLMPRCLVLLPFADDLGFFKRWTENRPTLPQEMKLRGSLVEWPREPTYAEDL